LHYTRGMFEELLSRVKKNRHRVMFWPHKYDQDGARCFCDPIVVPVPHPHEECSFLSVMVHHTSLWDEWYLLLHFWKEARRARLNLVEAAIYAVRKQKELVVDCSRQHTYNYIMPDCLAEINARDFMREDDE